MKVLKHLFLLAFKKHPDTFDGSEADQPNLPDHIKKALTEINSFKKYACDVKKTIDNFFIEPASFDPTQFFFALNYLLKQECSWKIKENASKCHLFDVVHYDKNAKKFSIDNKTTFVGSIISFIQAIKTECSNDEQLSAIAYELVRCLVITKKTCSIAVEDFSFFHNRFPVSLSRENGTELFHRNIALLLKTSGLSDDEITLVEKDLLELPKPPHTCPLPTAKSTTITLDSEVLKQFASLFSSKKPLFTQEPIFWVCSTAISTAFFILMLHKLKLIRFY